MVSDGATADSTRVVRVLDVVSTLTQLCFTTALLAAFLSFVTRAAPVFAGASNGGFGARLASAGAFLMASMIGWGIALSVGALVLHLRRMKVARFVTPLPGLLGVVAFGAWLLSGDPGDEPWLRVAFAISTVCFALTTASAVAGFPSKRDPSEPGSNEPEV